MKKIMTIDTLKTTLSVLCTVSFLSGCLATQEVKVDTAPPTKSSIENIINEEQGLIAGEPLQSRIQVQSVAQLQSGEKPQSNVQRQSKEQLQLMYTNYLKKEGYFPKIDSDGDVNFKKEGDVYFIDVRSQQEDPQYFRIVHPLFWSIDNEIERQEVLAVADRVNSSVKVVKIYTVKDDTWASVSIFVSNREDFKDSFPRLMSALTTGVKRFVQNMRKIRKQKI
ncbi:conserved hypothetical protein, secreted [Beggiatoa sp. PS]|nr:conserved hypothetical protein, secreted [Beggiatoa sp. PS]